MTLNTVDSGQPLRGFRNDDGYGEAHRKQSGKSLNSCPAPSRKTFRFPFDPNHLFIPAVPLLRGAARDRHERGAGCGGRGSVVARESAWASDGVAYGEVVWS